jgi:hypothetical protein
MRRHILPLTLAAATIAVGGCGPDAAVAPTATAPALATAPSDGNGNMIVLEYDIPGTVDCGSETITSSISGWVKVKLGQHFENRAPRLDVYQLVFSYSNAAGETFVLHDVGPDRFWEEDGIIYIQKAGRVEGHIGTTRFNLLTGEVVFIAGPDRGWLDDQACAALT